MLLDLLSRESHDIGADAGNCDLRSSGLRLQRTVLIGLASLALILSGVSIGAQAESERDKNLPAGDYLYLGAPGQAPRAFSISSAGDISWKENVPKTNVQIAVAGVGQLGENRDISRKPKKRNRNFQWDYRKYPIIRWKAHPVTIMPGASAQMNTSFDTKEDMFGRGLLKYSMRISEFPPNCEAVGIQLLDANGFKLIEFDIARNQFHPVPGSSVLEASDEQPCKKKEYWQARDYLVKQSSR